jgi:Phosphotransferase enzyme family
MAVAREAPGDAPLHDALRLALAEVGLGPPRDVARRRSEYATSFPLEELDVTLEDGDELPLVWKRLEWAALDESARLAKPAFLHDPLREPAAYASLLSPHGIGPRYFGSAIEPEAERYWLFLERVQGRELYQVGEIEMWRATAAWLAETHRALAGEVESGAPPARLIECDEAYYRRWLERAVEFAALAGDPERSRGLDWLAERYDPVVEALLDLPQTVIHGELYASNVLVGGEASAPRICPVDWEMAARGPGLLDLAALVSGGWREEERAAIVSAYRSVAGDAFSAERLDLARLHLCVQWLGWAPPSWVPPEGQRHDWLGEALALAEGLDL